MQLGKVGSLRGEEGPVAVICTEDGYHYGAPDEEAMFPITCSFDKNSPSAPGFPGL